MPCLWSRARLDINEKHIKYFCRYKTANLRKIQLLLLDSMKRQKQNKSRFETEFVKTQLFSCKNVPQIGSKTFPIQCFFTDHLKQKSRKQSNSQKRQYEDVDSILLTFSRFYHQKFKNILEEKIWLRPLSLFRLRGECWGKKIPTNLSLVISRNSGISPQNRISYK